MQIDIKELLLSLRKAALKADFECRKSLITLVVLCQHESNQRLPFELFAQLNSKNMEMYGLFLQFFLELSSVSTLGHLFSAYGDQKDYSEEPIFLLNILLGLIDFHLEKIKVNNASPRFDIDRILTTFFNAYNYEAGIIDIQKLCVLKQTDDDFISIAYLFSYFCEHIRIHRKKPGRLKS
ncbi:MAG: hypothetical protein HWD59_02565 [Coxiellaceae bacterium]|nr:MAG: hypothetical protein HWD59_02565 [Coxiellaceae bacterium]